MNDTTEPLIEPLSIGQRLGCATAILLCCAFWLGIMWGCYEYGRKQGCKTDAEVVAALQALHQPSVEIQP